MWKGLSAQLFPLFFCLPNTQRIPVYDLFLLGSLFCIQSLVTGQCCHLVIRIEAIVTKLFKLQVGVLWHNAHDKMHQYTHWSMWMQSLMQSQIHYFPKDGAPFVWNMGQTAIRSYWVVGPTAWYRLKRIHVNPERSFRERNGDPPSEASQLRKFSQTYIANGAISVIPELY